MRGTCRAGPAAEADWRREAESRTRSRSQKPHQVTDVTATDSFQHKDKRPLIDMLVTCDKGREVVRTGRAAGRRRKADGEGDREGTVKD